MLRLDPLKSPQRTTALLHASSRPAPVMRISTLFRSRKNGNNRRQPQPTKHAIAVSAGESVLKAVDSISSSPSSSSVGRGKGERGRGEGAAGKRRKASAWCVYLIISSTLPRTYVGVTTSFPRRLKQHNGEMKGGAKASRAGRPWLRACIVRGFEDRSEACAFETMWKSIARRLPRKCEKEVNGSKILLHHREKALVKVKDSLDCSHLEIDWAIDPY